MAGQLYTPLFYGVRTPSTFIAPVVEPLDVARRIVSEIEKRAGGEIYLPWYVGYMYDPSHPPFCVRWPVVCVIIRLRFCLGVSLMSFMNLFRCFGGVGRLRLTIGGL